MKLWDRLTPRESEIAELLIMGKGWVEIADSLGIARRTIKARARIMYLKAGLFEDPRRFRHVQLAVMLVYERWPELNLQNPRKVGAP